MIHPFYYISVIGKIIISTGKIIRSIGKIIISIGKIIISIGKIIISIGKIIRSIGKIIRSIGKTVSIGVDIIFNCGQIRKVSIIIGLHIRIYIFILCRIFSSFNC